MIQHWLEAAASRPSVPSCELPKWGIKRQFLNPMDELLCAPPTPEMGMAQFLVSVVEWWIKFMAAMVPEVYYILSILNENLGIGWSGPFSPTLLQLWEAPMHLQCFPPTCCMSGCGCMHIITWCCHSCVILVRMDYELSEHFFLLGVLVPWSTSEILSMAWWVPFLLEYKPRLLLPGSGDLASKRDRPLFRTSIHKISASTNDQKY